MLQWMIVIDTALTFDTADVDYIIVFQIVDVGFLVKDLTQ